MSQKKKVIHLTSVHSRYDTRIFIKECCSLSAEGYDVTLIVADGKGNEIRNNVKVVDVGSSKNRIERIFKTTKRVLSKAIEMNGDIYHFHDAELIPAAKKIKKLGKIVIYDIHEDLPRQTITKSYIPFLFRYILAKTLEVYENFASHKFSALVTATPYIKDRFKSINKCVITVNNFPILGELAVEEKHVVRENSICFVGEISRLRGVINLIESLQQVKSDCILYIVGKWSEPSLYEEAQKLEGWKRVVDCGFLERKAVAEIMNKSVCGVVTFLPAPNHWFSQPNKMFEYMSAGLPVLASNFSLWKEIIVGNNCGICVNPNNINEIANAIDSFFLDKEKSIKLGKNGQEAVLQKYNWDKEKKSLTNLYNSLV